MKILKRTILGCLLFANTVSAQIYEFSFTDTKGEQKATKPSSKYINPASDFKIVTILGLDRYITLKVSNERGVMLDMKSTVTTVKDRLIGSDGKEFYGKIVSVPAIGEGPISVELKVLDTSGNIISVENYKVIVDRTPPHADDISANCLRGTCQPGTAFKLGAEAGLQWDLMSLNVSDNNEVDSGEFRIYRNNEIYKKNILKYDPQLRKMYFSYSIQSMWQQGMPDSSDLDELFQAEFVIRDKAGNEYTTPKQDFYWDNVDGEIILYAIRDPKSNDKLIPGVDAGYSLYKPKMKVYENPVHLIYRVPSSNYRGNSDSGLYPISRYREPEVLADTGGYVYIDMTIPNTRGMVLEDMARFENWAAFRGPRISFDVTLANDVDQTPIFIEPFIERLSDKGEWMALGSKSQVLSSKLMPLTFSKVKYYVSPRSYEQKVIGITSTCIVPPGQNNCIADEEHQVVEGTQFHVRKIGTVQSVKQPILRYDRLVNLSWNNKILAEIQNLSIKNKNNLVIESYLSNDRDWWNYARLVEFSVADSNTGEIYSKTNQFDSRVNGKYISTVDLTPLPEGKVVLDALVTDYYGNVVKKKFGEYINDKTPPKIKITYMNEPVSLGNTVKGLENITINIKDNLTKPKIQRIQLSGGPTNDAVELNWIKKDNDDNYQLEYPRIFPVTDDNEKYTLTVFASDEQDNISSEKVEFKYVPANLIVLSNMKTLSVATGLKLSNNDPLAFLKTSILRKENGELAKGLQTGTITLRKDAAFSLTINGITVSPGESKEFQIDMKNGEETLIPIFPSKGGISGDASFMIEFPQLI